MTHDFCRLLLRSPKTTSFNSAILRPGPSAMLAGATIFERGQFAAWTSQTQKLFEPQKPYAACACCSSPGLAAPKIERFHCWANVIFATISLWNTGWQWLAQRLRACRGHDWRTGAKGWHILQRQTSHPFLVDLMSLRPWQACRLSKIFSPAVALNYQFLTFSDRCK